MLNNTIEICEELHQNFIDFAYEANSQRAFPDARDGLKPGQRACLWEMYSKGFTSNKPHVKSAKISGGTIATWWPHGDVAVYETFARMSQPWINNIPEVSWHGSNGNVVIGPEPASSRYTEARLSKATEDGMLQGLKKNVVPMVLNFSEDEEWPEVLPAIMPRLMINGSQGIGVTIANTWLPHNLCDISNVIIEYLKTNSLNIKNLAPDFPSGGIIINKDELHKIYETGKGKAVVRGRAEVKGSSIIITELPYQVYVEPLIEEIKKLVLDNTISGIRDIYNKSDKTRLMIEIDCDENPDKVLAQLFKTTDLQKSFSANQWALVGKTPRLMTFKDYCDIYIAHNIECIRREYTFDLNKAKDKQEIISGLVKALEDIDNIIALIKKSESSAAAKENLIKTYSFTENQAKAIVDMKLGRLSHLEKVELNKELEDLISTIENITNILSNENKINEILIDRLSIFTKKYGGNRKTDLMNISIKPEDKEIETVIPEDVVIILSQNGDIKRIPAKSFRVQRKNGKGVKSIDEAILDTISTNTIDHLMLFTSKGKMFKMIVDNIPEGTNTSKGTRINSLINLDSDEYVIAITSLNRKSNAKYVVFFTKNGLIKKTELEEYMKVKRGSGIAAINLKEGDSIANVAFINDEDVIIITKNGMSIRFETKNIAPIGRVTAGVKSIKLSDGDEVLIGLPVISNDDTVAVFTEKGFGKKSKIEEFPVQGRAGKGVLIYKPTPTTGNLVGATIVNDKDNILLVGRPNSICIAATDVPQLARASVGNIMIKNTIISVVKI